MDKRTRNILLSCGVLLIIVCLCLGAATAVGAGVLILRPASTSMAPFGEILPTPNTQLPTPNAQLPTPLPTSTAQSALDPQISQSMDLIQSQVVSLRGLDPSQSVPRRLLSDAELRDKVINDFLSEYTPEDASQDARVLALLGLLPADFDLRSLYTELYSEQIAGFYDDEEKAMYVVQGAGFTGMEKSTYAHEYTHVLQDQVYDFNDGLGYTDETCQEDTERCAGIQALIEGDAVLTETLWLQTYASEQDIRDLMSFYNDYESPVFDSAPHYMSEDFMFPYVKGQAFVQGLYDQGGFEAVDAAYRQVPMSTEQILHPEKYPTDLPIPVDLPDLSASLGTGWEEVDRNVMGEWYTYLILAHGFEKDIRINDSRALTGSAGWGGDTYLVYENGTTKELAFVMRSTWDTAQDLDEFVKAFTDYSDARWGKSTKTGATSAWQGQDTYSLFYVVDGFATWIMAPNGELAERISTSLP